MTSSVAPLRVPFRGGEPAYAAFERLAVAAGARSATVFAAERGLDLAAISCGRLTEGVAKLAGWPTGSLVSATFLVGADGVSLGGVTLDRCDWSSARRRVCPSCLAGDLPWRRSWWDLMPIRRCHVHGVPLVAEAADPVPVPSDAPDDVVAETWVLGRLGFASPTSAGLLDRLPVSRAIDLVEMVGASAGAGRWGLRDARRVDVTNLLRLGFPAFAGGVASFVRHLDGLVATARPGRNGIGPGEAYGRLYRWLSSEELDPAFDEIRDVVRDHACSRLPIPAGASVLGRPAPLQRHWSLAQVARRLGVQKPFAERLLRVSGASNETGATGVVYYTSASVARAESLATGTAWGADAARSLGLAPYAFRSVVQAGCLDVALFGRAVGSRDDRFWKSKVDGLARRLLDGVEFLERAPEGTTDLKSAAVAAMSSTGAVVAAVLDGRLRAAGRLSGRAGIGGLLVVTREAFDLHDLSTGEGIVSWSEVVRAVGRKSVADALVASGHLTRLLVPMGFRNRRRLGVDRQEWARFGRRFVSAADLAKGRRTSVEALARELAAGGTHPTLVAGGRRFYERVAETGMGTLSPPRRRAVGGSAGVPRILVGTVRAGRQALAKPEGAGAGRAPAVACAAVRATPLSCGHLARTRGSAA